MLQKVDCDIRSTDHALTIARDGLTSQTHLLSFNMGCLKTLRVDRRGHRDFETQLRASLDGQIAGIDLGFKEHDQLLLAR